MKVDKNLYALLKVETGDKYHTERIFHTIDACMKEMEGLKDSYEILDYGISHFTNTELESDKDYTLISQVNVGGSEGIYVDVYLIGSRSEKICVGTYKTLEDDINASLLMGKIAGAFVFLYELYYMTNF